MEKITIVILIFHTAKIVLNLKNLKYELKHKY